MNKEQYYSVLAKREHPLFNGNSLVLIVHRNYYSASKRSQRTHPTDTIPLPTSHTKQPWRKPSLISYAIVATPQSSNLDQHHHNASLFYAAIACAARFYCTIATSPVSSALPSSGALVFMAFPLVVSNHAATAYCGYAPTFIGD